jgi:beta-N-acetylglucosaminidase
MNGIEGKTAIVTGGARGIGKAIVLKLSGLGANVVVNYSSSPDKAEELVKSIKENGGNAIAVKANVSSSSKVKIRTEASTKSKYLTNKSNNQVALSNGKSIYIINEVTDSSGDKWFKITFTVSNVSYSGYIPAEKVLFRVTAVDSTPTPPKDNGNTTAPTDKPTPETPTPETPTSPTPIPAQDIKVINTPTEANIFISSQIYFNAGGSDLYKDGAGNPIILPVKQKVTIYDTITANMVTWYFIEAQLNSISYYGYVKAENVLTNTSNEAEVPPSSQVLTDAEFEAEMMKQGFPNSYKSLLMQLHKQHPTWIFEAYQTGLDWNTVMEREGAVGINLLSNGKSIEWKSTEQGAYNWKTDKFVPYDGSTWVTSSKEATAYYMDPRNFIDEKGIFQFELLSYNKGYQSVSGVEGILFNTPLYNCNYTYVNNEGNQDTISYAETFVDAAEYSGVSPYHLAARVKQEVVTGMTSLSSSVSGTVSGLEGLFNFYNIGAFNSTAPGGAVANGLKYAKNGTTSQELNLLYRIPWDSPYDSIVGGAYIIGRNYINKGQNTIYMQKFNVTPTSTFSHQYMANVEAPSAEAKKTYAAYSGMMDVPIVFSVPVYLNMPETVSPMPVKKYNPNNWLKTLEVDGYSISPTFDLTIDQPYDLTVENTTEFINISAIPVSTKATVTGIGTIPLQIGNNSLVITVTAENGDNRNYTINVVRELQ